MKIIRERNIKIWHENCYLRLYWRIFSPFVCTLIDLSRALNSVVNTEQQKLNSIRYGFSFFSGIFFPFLKYRLVVCCFCCYSLFFVSPCWCFILVCHFWWVILLFSITPIKLAAMLNFKQLNFLFFFFLFVKVNNWQMPLEWAFFFLGCSREIFRYVIRFKTKL